MSKKVDTYFGSNTPDEKNQYTTKTGDQRSVYSVVVTPTLQAKFRAACRKTGIPASEMIRKLMNEFVTAKEEAGGQ